MIQPARNTPSARKGAVLVCGLAISACLSVPCLGLVEVMEGNQPVSHLNNAAWRGLLEVVNDPSRVLLASGPTVQHTAYYQGDTTALERVLRAFAAVETEERQVILLPGCGDSWLWRDRASAYDWRLEVNHASWKVPVLMEVGSRTQQAPPTLTVFVGGSVDLERLKIPEGLTLVGVNELRDHYRGVLSSGDRSARADAARQLAQIDPYGREATAAVEKLLEDDALRKSAEQALAKFRERAADPPGVQSTYESDARRIRRFVFAWRYGWLERAIGIAVIAAAALLLVTVVLGKARRADKAGAP